MSSPYSPAAERNRAPILGVLRRHFEQGWRVLEIGAGTGQHARYFAAGLEGVVWQATETRASLPVLLAGLAGAATPAPLPLDVLADDWPDGPWQAVYSANTAHIMGWPAVRAMLRGAGRVLDDHGLLAIYGPFARGGRHTSESNRRFDAQLRERDPAMGVRNLDDMDESASASGLARVAEYAMPANNLLLIWRKEAPA